ncbi:MAG TPA: nucleotidyltransferase domain-containing protein [Ignavibacteria bacterium]|nr:nucleotidyltransferase domain-containing protein [Ignavibacteria bacterium]
MNNRSKILNDISNYFDGFSEVAFAYLYGSFGSKYQNKFSDVDIAIYQSNKKSSYDYRMIEFRIEADLCQLYPEFNFDVRSLNDAPIIVIGKIINKGKPVFVRDENQHLDYVELNRLKYMDYQIIYKPLFDYRYKQLLND